jgi:hypothetical protein
MKSYVKIKGNSFQKKEPKKKIIIIICKVLIKSNNNKTKQNSSKVKLTYEIYVKVKNKTLEKERKFIHGKEREDFVFGRSKSSFTRHY